MQSQLPLWLQTSSSQALHGVSGKALTRDYERLSAGYRFGNPAEAKTAWLAYLAARMPATYAAISAVLSQIPSMASASCNSLLDLGSGPGTACWAVSEKIPLLKKIQAIEIDDAALALAAVLSADAPVKPEFIRADLSAGLAGAEEADLVLAAYVANEIEPEKRAALFEAAWAKTRQLLVWVEPGTPQGFEVILQLLAQLLAAGAHIVAPCPQGASACPLSADPRAKWCHFSQRLERNRTAKLAKASELGYEDEKYCYLILSKTPQSAPGARVLGRPKKLEGQVLLELCAPKGLQALRLSRRDKARYKAAKKAEWGDLWSPD